MPRFDGSGPLGKGSFTGRGMGYCVGKIDQNMNDSKKGVNEMPRGDGTGPMGQGPMTGRGAGFCAGYPTPGYTNPVPGRGFNAGFGRGAGRGGGRGRRNWYYATGLPGWARATNGMPAFGGWGGASLAPKDEAQMLKQQSDILKQQLEDIQGRISTLEKAQQQEKSK
ncbi:DUF5320 domain-containing protein [Candidatus Omnitrophota bacterium]